MDEDRFLSIDEIQAEYDVSEATAWSYLSRFNLARYRIPSRGRKTLVKKSELDAALNRPVPVRPGRKVKGKGKAAA